MRRVRAFLLRVAGLFGGAARDRELAAELDSHLQMHIDDNLRAGMSAEEARRQALLRLGGVEQAKESYREQRSLPWLEMLWQDLRFGGRVLLRNPGFTVVAVLTLALGIGATTAMFSVVNGVLLLPLPYQKPERLALVYETSPTFNFMSVAYLNFRDWQRRSHSFEAMAAYRTEDFNLTGAGEPEHLGALQVSADFFHVLGVTPLEGRSFTAEEDQAGGARVCVVSYGFWQQRLGGDAAVLGRGLTLNGAPYKVIGVLRRDFYFPTEGAVYLPLGQAEPTLIRDRKMRPGMHVVARLKDGVSLQQANLEMQAIGRELAQEYPDANGKHGATVRRMRDDIVGSSRQTLYLLLGAVVLVLLIACANVANLLLARSAGRAREFAVRLAMGARRTRVVRQLLTESMLLSVAAGGLGLALANWGTRAALHAVPQTLPRAQQIGVDGNVLLFAVAVSLLTGMLFGMAPALQSFHMDFHPAVKEGGRGSARHGAQNVFVASEFALALLLLIGAGLMIRSLAGLWSIDPGFDPHHAITMQIALSPSAYHSAPKTRLAFEQLLQRVRGLAGVRAAALTTLVPLSDSDSEIPYWVGTAQNVPPEQKADAEFYITGTGYLEAMKIPLLRGRFFNQQDTTSSLPVVVIDEVFARQRFPGQDPVGQRVTMDLIGTAQIVGVVGHVKQFGLDTDATMKSAREEIYFPFAQVPDQYMQAAGAGIYLTVRTERDPLGMVAAIRGQVMGSERDQPVFNVATLEQVIAGSLARRRFAMMLLGAFAAIALALAAIGIYGVISYSVAQRTQEIGIRMALGAERADVVRMVMRQGLALCLAGVAAGIAAALAATRLLASLLYGVRPTDVATFVSVALLLGGVALLASYLPARRATRVDPMIALRYE